MATNLHRTFGRYIVALAFSPDGLFLAVVTADNAHSVYVYELNLHVTTPPRRCFAGQGHKGEPPQVFGVLWNPFKQRVDPRTGRASPAPLEFVTFGVKHLKFWRCNSMLDETHFCDSVLLSKRRPMLISCSCLNSD